MTLDEQMLRGGRARTTRRNNPDGAREAILDAAERLFSARGYYGVALREIAAEADLKLNMVTYHFGTKDELFARTIARRAPVYVAMMEEAVAAAVADPEGGAPSVEAVLRAFAEPALKLSSHGGPGWKSYMQLVAHAMNNRQDADFLRPARDLFDPLLRKAADALQRARPDVDPLKVHWAFYFVEAALVHILTEAGLVDRHSDGRCRSSDLDRILEEMIPFFSRGFEALPAEAATSVSSSPARQDGSKARAPRP